MERRELPETVSAREAQVLISVGDRLTNAEIAAALFISVRTVESHVSSLLRKLGASDRRELAARAVAAGPSLRPAGTGWPAPLTSFIGRTQERRTLGAALESKRLVTAVGPGGVGKTRLALTVAADAVDRYPDGSWYVDLVPVSDSAMVVAAVSEALGLGEQRRRSQLDAVAGWLSAREALLVLDNCEHVTDGVVGVLEFLLSSCPKLTVLCTSRARLLVPYEWVFAVPGLSVGANDDAVDGDAVELFTARAVAAGAARSDIDPERVAAICRGLDGMALAIELAAARLPGLGLDGLEAGLADRLEMLHGGRRIDDRHRSLRSALDWSYALLGALDQAVLRRVSVFAAPFTVGQAASVLAGWAPIDGRDLARALARLADGSLLVAGAGFASVAGAGAGAGPTRYRALETIRQYGAERLSHAGEVVDAHLRHQSWARQEAAALADDQADTGRWPGGFDELADELRAALTWAGASTDHRQVAHDLARELGDVCFRRGFPGEAQRRYEQAAEFAADSRLGARDLRSAANAAEARHLGDDAIRLHQAAATAALGGGDDTTAAGELAAIVELVHRGAGLIDHPPSDDEVRQALVEASRLAGADPVARAQVSVAAAFAAQPLEQSVKLVEGAIAQARACGDVASESAALDQLMSQQLLGGRSAAAAASATRRAELLIGRPIDVDIGMEFLDGFNMATDTAICVGDLTAARRYAQRVHDLPFLREGGHLATARLLVVTALSGDWDAAAGLARRYRDGWERAGRPHDGDLNRGAYAATTVFGLRGDDATRAEWLDLFGELVSARLVDRDRTCYRSFDALLLLHRGDPEAALAVLGEPVATIATWHHGMWRAWHAAFWAEASALAARPDPSAWLERSRAIAAENAIARAIVERSAAIRRADRAAILATTAAFEAAGCPYQVNRTLELAALISRD